MGKEIEFLTDQTFLTPGETVTVPIVIHLEKSMKVRHISAVFHAAERTKATYTTTTTDAKGKRKRTTKTAVEYHDLAKKESSLLGEPTRGCLQWISEFFSALGGMGRGVYLQAGRHEYSMEFIVPEPAPPTIKGTKFEVFYKLTAHVDLPLKFDYTHEHKYKVAHDATTGPPQGNPIVAYYPDEKGRGFWQKTFGKDARLTLALQNDAYAKGDEIVAMFQAETEQPITVRQVRARLVCIESSRASNHSDSHTHQGELMTIADGQEILGGFSTQFRLPNDLDAPHTITGKNFEVNWFVEVSMDVPWAADPSIRVPIRIAPSRT